MNATREKKIKFIKRFGRNGFTALRDAVAEIVAREGADFLTDEQIDAIASMRAADARYTQHHNMRERAKYQQRLADRTGAVA